MDSVGFVVGNATQTATFYQLALGMDLEAYRGPETGYRDSKSYVLRSGSARFVFTGGVTPDSPVARPPPPPRRRRRRPGARGPRRRQVHRARASHRRDRPGRAARRVRRARHRPDRRHRDVRRDPAHPDRPQPATTAPTCPGYVAARDDGHPPRGPPQAALPGDRPLRRQRRARPHGRVGGLLQQGHGLHEHGGVHRRRHRHRLLRADEQGRRERQPPGEVPAQRAGDREEEVADRRVPRVLRRRRLPAHRPGDQRHPAQRRHPARQRHRVPRHPGLLLRRPRAARPDRRGAGRRSRS